ncbi:MAG: hypothetical protein IPJ95_00120 [Gemmatimonadetes bacterium]|nr:hypothetical protein [Gemmatimonadota bacterium]
MLSSGPAFTQSVQYLASSGAAKITQTAGASGYEVGTYDPEGAPDEPTLGAPLGPIWVEQHGPSRCSPTPWWTA